VADQPESLRLFDLDSDSASLTETTESYRFKTPPTESRIETPARECAPENLLRAVAEAATMVRNANRQLDAAIEAARAACLSWREIGIAAGIPYQTLHRRHHQGGAR
jgi:hypothetical protein